MNVPPMVSAIIALRPLLPPVSDELRKRVQSIRVRSITDNPSSRVASLQQSQNQDRANWRNKQDSNMPSQKHHHGNSWRNNSGLSTPVSPVSPVSPVPFRFINSERSPKLTQPTDSSLTPKPVNPWTGGTRYISKFHNGAKAGDDKILRTIILNKLNVFSVKTYDDVKQFLFQILGSDQKEFIREFTWMVFRKAAAENKFCSLYAKLLSEIKKEYPVILEEMKKLHNTYLDIWKITETPDLQVDKRYRLGYSQFLAELTVLGVLDLDSMKLTLETLKACIAECISNEDQKETIDEYMNCLKQLCNSRTPGALKSMIKELLVSNLSCWIETPSKEVSGLSSRSRFACMDILDLLKSG
jgi:hypothetical protein